MPLYFCTVVDSGVGQRQLNGTVSKTLYKSKNLMKINVLHHYSPWKKNSEFRGILTMVFEAVAVPHHCRPL